MYINDGSTITNTASNFSRSSYDTLPYNVPERFWYNTNPYYYTDANGNVKVWNSLGSHSHQVQAIPGGRYCGTPTRTGSYFIQNTIPN